MTRLSEVARLQKLIDRRAAILLREQNPCSPNYALLERIEIERDLIDAAGWLLAIAGSFEKGDALDIRFALSGEYAPGTCNCVYCKETTKVLRRLLHVAQETERPE